MIPTREILNQFALIIDWRTFQAAQEALAPFRTAPMGGVDISKNPLEWRIAADLKQLASDRTKRAN